MDINDEYIIIDEEDNENQLEAMEQEYSLGTTTGLSALDQVSQITNLKSYLPLTSTDLYKPGDSWDVEFYTDVKFIGTGTLLGYINYNGIECAVIKNEFQLNTEADNILDTDDLEEVIEIEDGSISSIIYWDVAAKIPRYLKTTIYMTTELDMDDDKVEPMVIPMTEIIESYFSPL